MTIKNFSKMIPSTFALISVIVTGCNGSANTQEIAQSNPQGSLTLVANGEDFVRQGFVTKDNWQVNFDRVAVNVGNAIAFSTESAFNPEESQGIKDVNYSEKVPFVDGVTTIDLAAGDDNAEPIVVEQANVPTGSYNALAWEMLPHDDSGLTGQTIVLQGNAVKGEETVNFKLGFAVPVKYLCGEFVGEDRKGIVSEDSPAEIEMTFHFDHVFGDFDTPAEEAINQDALGFQPIADLSSSGVIEADWQTLQQQLSVSDREKLTEAIIGLGHVGEGHCKAEYEL